MNNLNEMIKNAKTFSINMQNNLIYLDDILINTNNIKFSCNWSKQNIVKIIDEKVLNADHHNTNITIDGKRIDLPLYNYILLSTKEYNLISIGWYSEN